ncbi:MAG: hypothetical protein IPK08_14645 [Bacteroidetes bacterium]|nr:hypothetical protein [Bacteroidota bacterium]
MKSPSQQIVFLRYKWDVLVLILLLPLIAINFNGFHDAGDDFAQYLLQAKWLTGNQQAWNPDHTGNYSPGIKGWLFSVLLIPATLVQPSNRYTCIEIYGDCFSASYRLGFL